MENSSSVLAEVEKSLAQYDITLSKTAVKDNCAVILTGKTEEKNMQNALKELAEIDGLSEAPVLIRMEV